MKKIIETMIFNKSEFKEVTEILTGTLKDGSRPVLQCLHFTKDEVVAVDGYRMMLRKNNNMLLGDYNINRADIKTMLDKVKEFNENIEKISIEFNEDNTATLKINDVEKFNCMLVSTEYIKYQELIPIKFKTLITISPKEIKETIKPLRKNKKILFTIENEVINIKDIEEIKDNKLYQYKATYGNNIDYNIQCESIEGKDITIAFNHTYIKEALKHYNNKEKINIKLNRSLDGVLITNNKNKIDFVLPVRIIK